MLPVWWDEVVERVKRGCTGSECDALDRLGQDEKLMRALALQWRNTSAIGDHDGEKFVRAVLMALAAASNADAREELMRQLAHLERAAEKLRAAGEEFSRVAEQVEREADSLRRELRDPVYRMRAPHTIFAVKLAAFCAADWLGGVVGDAIIARAAEVLFGAAVDADMVRQLRRRRR